MALPHSCGRPGGGYSRTPGIRSTSSQGLPRFHNNGGEPIISPIFVAEIMMPSSEVNLEELLVEQRRRWKERTPILVEGLLEQQPSLCGRKEVLLDLINHEIVL